MSDVGRKTSRDVLVLAAGEEHGRCTVMSKKPIYRGALRFACRCGITYEVAATPENVEGLRNVLEVSS